MGRPQPTALTKRGPKRLPARRVASTPFSTKPSRGRRTIAVSIADP